MSINNIWIGNDKVNSIEIKTNGIDKTVQETKMQPFIPLENYTWTEIKQMCQNGECAYKFAIGDTKTILGSDGYTYTIQVVDLQEGRYKYTSNGNPTHCTFEFKDLILQNMTLDDYARPYSQSNMHTTTLPNVLSMFSDISSLVDEIYIKCENPINSNTTENVATKLYLASLNEIYNRTGDYCANETISTYNSNQYNQFDYYKTNTSLEAHIKNNAHFNNPFAYWIRTPSNEVSNTKWYYITTDGAEAMDYVYRGTKRVAPCFAW